MVSSGVSFSDVVVAIVIVLHTHSTKRAPRPNPNPNPNVFPSAWAKAVGTWPSRDELLHLPLYWSDESLQEVANSPASYVIQGCRNTAEAVVEALVALLDKHGAVESFTVDGDVRETFMHAMSLVLSRCHR